jgi:hypothetical protein
VTATFIGHQTSQREGVVSFDLNAREMLELMDDGGDIKFRLLISFAKGMEASPIVS